mmetsp:Transcript_11982/g.19867  ORF Transcript_11982/g.19867 Transcript_11982/m.19867 type:complete len:156 (-) Transcript_11982:1569-2036(-)
MVSCIEIIQQLAAVTLALILTIAAPLPTASAFTVPTASFGRPPIVLQQQNKACKSSAGITIFSSPSPHHHHQCQGYRTSSRQANVPGDGSNKEPIKVVLGGKEYYDGFLNRKLDEEPLERVSGDNLLQPILKFAGLSAVVIGAFLLAFLASNGLL